MLIKITRQTKNQKLIIKEHLKKRLEINIKLWKTVNIQNEIFSRSALKIFNQNMKKNLIKLKLVLLLRDGGILS